MNLIKAAELLKGAPDSELAQYLQNPTGEFPEYLVASEKLRREEMRQRFNQAQPSKTSIIDELLQKDSQQLRQKMQPQQQMPQQMPPEAMGLGAVPPPEGMQLSQAPMMEAAQQQPQQFYDGGVVALAGGGDPRDYQLSQWLGIEPTAAGRMSQEEIESARSREIAAREIFGDSRMNGQMGAPDMYGAGTNIDSLGLSGQYTPFTNQAMGQANISQPMAGGIANIGATGTLNPTGGKISSLNASYGNPDINVLGSFNPNDKRFTGRVGHGGYGVSADVGKNLERVGVDYSDGQTMGGINYMPGQNAVQGQVSHLLDPNTQISVGGQYGKQKEIAANILKKLFGGELRAGIRYGDSGLSGNVNLTRPFAQGGLAGLSSEIHDYLESYAAGGEVKHFNAGDAVKYQPDLSAFDIDTKLTQPQAITEVKELADYQKQMADLVGPSAAEGYQDILSKQRSEIEGRKKNYLSDFLIKSGLGMAMSKENPLQAAAQGLAGGFENYQKAKEQDAAAERSLVDSEFKFKQAQRAENMGLLGLSRQAMGDAMADRRAGQEAARSSESLRIQAAIGKNNAINQAAHLGISEKELVLRTQEIAAAAQRHRETMAMEEKRIKSQIERDNAITPATKINAAEVVSRAIEKTRTTLETTMPEWYKASTDKIVSLANNPVAQQVEMQRLENRIRMESGLSADILKIAGFN